MPYNDNLTNYELGNIIDLAGQYAKENDDISNLRRIQETREEPEKELVEDIASFAIKADGKPNYAVSIKELKEANVDIMEAESIETITEDKAADAIKSSPAGFDLTDEEATNMAQILIMYKSDKNMNVYAHMCPSMKERINRLCFESNIDIRERNMVAKYMIEQFIHMASEEEEFIDIEKSLEKAMKIPSLIDIYTEHVNETMNVRIPIMAEKIREEDPEKAEALMKICHEYNNAFLYTRMRDLYDTHSSVRKEVRKRYSIEDIAKKCSTVNTINDRTKFKMPDSTKLLGVLSTLFQNDKEIHPSDICKFVTLVLESVFYVDIHSVVDNSYLYYLFKNITMLSYVGDKLSDFSAELISNIKITIFYIRLKEEEVNGRDSSRQSKSMHKRSNKK